MPNGTGVTTDFLLGQIVARLDANDNTHEEIKVLIAGVAKVQAQCNVEVATLKEKARNWGSLAGFVAGGLVSGAIALIGLLWK